VYEVKILQMKKNPSFFFFESTKQTFSRCGFSWCRFVDDGRGGGGGVTVFFLQGNVSGSTKKRRSNKEVTRPFLTEMREEKVFAM